MKSVRSSQSYSKWRHFLQKITFGLCLLLSVWLVLNTITLIYASSQAVDANFVLGGSIKREIYAAELATNNPKIPTLISQGSQDPCILRIFQKKAVNLSNVWLEKCANSTFGNFFYSLPILQKWKVHKVRLITSSSHLPRAKWMAQIILGSHGIWVELDIAKETGVPGNRESWFKTGLDVTRSMFWAGLSHFIRPQCADVIELIDVDMKAWQQRGFNCERQGREL
ncbi:YdcF family protein [Calothrix sp. UHCC 0171]|uniref:YdcF family protein n=1 Tax=Calothrix sp. UHCC 0171 TaxID=3110245 RepID=UPI002B220E76|nr:YdcF family protein [Calothrix sp. UHCC 0171]MEA5570590.1 YdcF family protein [Calothrix sp. UHCC 0171]